MSCVAADAEWSDCQSSSVRSAVTQHTYKHIQTRARVRARRQTHTLTRTHINMHPPPLPEAVQLSSTGKCIVLANVYFVHYSILQCFAKDCQGWVGSEPLLYLNCCPGWGKKIKNKKNKTIPCIFPLMICFCSGHSHVKSITGSRMLKCEGRG